jgi:hypothetical protein
MTKVMVVTEMGLALAWEMRMERRLLMETDLVTAGPPMEVTEF